MPCSWRACGAVASVLVVSLSLLSTGCTLAPLKLHQPQFHNPWPQLHKVAVGPFYNLSENPTVKQDEFAHAYYSELSQIFGFEVVPIGVTRQAMLQHGIRGESAAEFQRLAQLMEVDAIVVGTINEFTPYYPPRLTMSVRWYAANPCFHPMPAGYGLPWGRAEEEFIPDQLVKAAEFELAKAQLKTQTPTPPVGPVGPTGPAARTDQAQAVNQPQVQSGGPDLPVTLAQAQLELPEDADIPNAPPAPDADAEELPPGIPHALPANPQTQSQIAAPTIPVYGVGPAGESTPPTWPDPSGFIPSGPSPVCPTCRPRTGPIIEHTRSYNGHDSDFTEALANYYKFRDDARFGGWQAYLQRSDDFIRFCCHMHLAETLAARGGADETKVVYRWPKDR